MIFVIGGAYQGKTEYVKKYFGEGYEIVDGYHQIVQEQMEQGKNPLEEAKVLLEREQRKGELVIVSNEQGYGLVPMEKSMRAYREMSGRVNCYLAGEAREVYRVVCGIPSRIK